VNAKRDDHLETFADIVNAVRETPPRSSEETWTSPIGDGEWHDSDGTRWQMRGDLLDAKQTRRLFNRPGVRVMHFEAREAKPSEVHDSERLELRARIDQFFKNQTDPPDWIEFHVAKFRGDDGRTMLVVVEFDDY
jgi:hypothetical protein